MTAQHQPRKSSVRLIHLPCFRITIRLDHDSTAREPGSGTITSGLKREDGLAMDHIYNVAIDAVESLILAHACAGIDVESPAYVEGIETAVEAIANHLSC